MLTISVFSLHPKVLSSSTVIRNRQITNRQTNRHAHKNYSNRPTSTALLSRVQKAGDSGEGDHSDEWRRQQRGRHYTIKRERAVVKVYSIAFLPHSSDLSARFSITKCGSVTFWCLLPPPVQSYLRGSKTFSHATSEVGNTSTSYLREMIFYLGGRSIWET